MKNLNYPTYIVQREFKMLINYDVQKSLDVLELSVLFIKLHFIDVVSFEIDLVVAFV